MSSPQPSDESANAPTPPRRRDRTIEFDFVLEAPRESTLRRSRPAAKNATAPASVAEDPAAPARPKKASPPPLPRTQRATEARAAAATAQPRQKETTMPTSAPIRRSSPPAARTSAGGSVRNPSVDDFRRNAERQSREQNAVGSVLAWVGYSLLGGLLLVAALAAFGGYTLMQMIEKQSVTVAQLDALYRAEFESMREDMAAQAATQQASFDALTTELADARRLAAKQQETIRALIASSEQAAAQAADNHQALTDQLAKIQEELDTEAGRRWKGDKDMKGDIYSLDKRLDSLEYRLRRN